MCLDAYVFGFRARRCEIEQRGAQPASMVRILPRRAQHAAPLQERTLGAEEDGLALEHFYG